MSQFSNWKISEQQQRLRKQLKQGISEQDDDVECLDEPIHLYTTAKLPAIDFLSRVDHTTDPRLNDVQARNEPITPPILPGIDIERTETQLLPVTRLRDFISGEQDPRQSYHDISVPHAPPGIGFILSAIKQHCCIYGRAPACICVPRELIHAVMDDIQTLCGGDHPGQIPFHGQDQPRVFIQVAVDDSLPSHLIRCRGCAP